MSKSACEFSNLRKRSTSEPASPAASSPVAAQGARRKQEPWYMAVIHEKDNRLLTLGKEVQRLLELEAQSRRKDEAISALQEEREALQKQLRCLPRTKGRGSAVPPSKRELREQLGVLQGSPGCSWERLPEARPQPGTKQELLPWKQMHEELAMRAKGWARAGGSLEGEEAERGQGPGEKGALQEDASEEEEEGEEEEEEEEEEEGKEEEEGERELLEEEEAWRRRSSIDQAFEDELMARLEECEQVIQELQGQLEATRSGYSMATGTIASLKRQVDFQEAQMRKLSTGNETLQRELQERKRQLQAMTDKFSNLREDKKHAGMMRLIEKDNLLLRQRVLDLESELRERDQLILEYDSKVGQLQAQVDVARSQLQRQQHAQEELRSANEVMQQAEQQARVALESAQCRLERLRNKIIQATFSTAVAKSVSTEISDNDILDCLQRVIAERTEYYNQLKQKGVKVPPLHQAEVSLSPNKTKRSVTK